MGRLETVRAEDVEGMMGLAGELMALPADATVRMQHLLEGLCKLVGGDPASVRAEILAAGKVAVEGSGEERGYGERERMILDLFERHIARRIHGRVWQETYGKFMGLAPRVRETLTHLMAGKSGKEIARAMGISVFSVNDYLKEIYRHYGVSGRGELMAKWNGSREGTGSE